MKNIIFIPYIKREKDLTGKSSIGHSNRHQGYEYGINSWKAWAKKNGHEVYIMSEKGGPSTRLTYDGAFASKICAWSSENR